MNTESLVSTTAMATTTNRKIAATEIVMIAVKPKLICRSLSHFFFRVGIIVPSILLEQLRIYVALPSLVSIECRDVDTS